MRDYVLKRLVQMIPTILLITLVVFAMMQTIPGDPIISLLGDASNEEDTRQLRRDDGLDQPLAVQYVLWLGRLVRGDWGTSILTGRSVLQDVRMRLPVTVELIALSMAVAIIIALPAGILASLRQNTWADYTAMTSALAGLSIPDFFLGILLLLVFSFALHGALPSSGWVYWPGTCPSLACQESVGGNLRHAIMPALARGVGRAAILTRLLRASMLEIIRMEYVTTARAKGWAEKTVMLKHALKNALIPTVTLMGLHVGFLIGGAMVIETLFALPGLGTYGINAIIARDYQHVQGCILLVALCFVVINFVVDLTYAFFDPRIRYGT